MTDADCSLTRIVMRDVVVHSLHKFIGTDVHDQFVMRRDETKISANCSQNWRDAPILFYVLI